MKNKFQLNILKNNQNENSLLKKNTNRIVYNPNKDLYKSSQIIANSGWKKTQAVPLYSTAYSSDKTKNNVLVGRYDFWFYNLNLSEEKLKDVSFIIETIQKPSLTPIAFKNWYRTRYLVDYNITSVYSPISTLCYRLSGNNYGGDNTIYSLYSKPKWQCSYVYQGTNKSGTLRSLSGYYSYTDEGDIHKVTFYMHSFTSVTSTSAIGIAYYTDYNQTTETYDSGFKNDFSITYEDTSRTYGAIGSFSSDVSNVFRLDRLDVLDSGANFVAQVTDESQPYFDSNYFWPIIGTGLLSDLPTVFENRYAPLISYHDPYPPIPESVKVITYQDTSIVETKSIFTSELLSTGNTFSFFKEIDGNYSLRLGGGIGFETNVFEDVDNSYAYATETQLNYDTDAYAVYYDSSEVLKTLDIKEYIPASQDVEIRCLVVYNPINSFNSVVG